MNNEFNLWKNLCYTRVDAFLRKALITKIPALQHFFDAMAYSTVDSGKRIRAMLVFATGAYLNVPEQELDIYATAIEIIHSASLIHDDLPAMDNDILRRGKPTCHIAFGEGTAIVAGDALLIEAFRILSGTLTPHFNSLKRIKMLAILAEKSGPIGMAGGQYLDLEGEKKKLSLEELMLLHRLKTGALIEATIALPLLYSEPTTKISSALQEFARKMGLIFQIQDDLLDVKKTSEELGKTAGKDENSEKATFVRLLGLKEAEQFLEKEISDALQLLDSLPGDIHFLNLVFEFICEREY